MSKGFSPLTALLVVATFAALLLAGLAYDRALDGGDIQMATGGQTGTDVSEPVAVPVTLTEFSISPEPLVAPPDGTLEVSNVGVVPHNLKIEGMEDDYGTPDLNGGDQGSIDTTGLEPGEYPIYCTIAGHAETGMTSTLVIDPDATPALEDEVIVADDAEGVGTDETDLTGMERAEWLRANYEASVGQFPAETSAMGNQPMEPEVLSDGTKVFELTIDETEWEVAPGEFVEAVAYNGQVPGPWIQTDVGDRVTIRIVNELDDQATTLHPHGIFMHPFAVDGRDDLDGPGDAR